MLKTLKLSWWLYLFKITHTYTSLEAVIFDLFVPLTFIPYLKNDTYCSQEIQPPKDSTFTSKPPKIWNQEIFTKWLFIASVLNAVFLWIFFQILTIIMTEVRAVMTFAMATTGAMALNRDPMEAEARHTMYSASIKKKKWSAPSRKPIHKNKCLVFRESSFHNWISVQSVLSIFMQLAKILCKFYLDLFVLYFAHVTSNDTHQP